MPEALQANYHHEISAEDMVDKSYKGVPESMSLGEFSEQLSQHNEPPWFIRTNHEGKVDGVIERDRALIWRSQHEAETTLKEFPFLSYEQVSRHAKLFDVSKKISKRSSHLVMVMKHYRGESAEKGDDIDNVLGIITRDNVARVTEQAMQLFSG